ncbi:hypothetical protein HZ326_27371 [Fusarium oxysporum f. sp. albedinis]|nr:hypothetical protein HZ326_27371 [Fusarium oxysporum f. sp. albedinis]
MDRLIQYEIAADMDHDSDHLPIVTSLNIIIIFVRCLQRKLPPQRRPRAKTALDRHTEEVMAARDEAVPKTTLPPRSKLGWTEACTEASAESKLLCRQHSLYCNEETWEAYHTARYHKRRVIEEAFKQIH